MNEILKKIGEIGIVPVIKIEDAEDALPLCRALSDGGLPVAEITFRTSAAEESIRKVAGNLPEILLGAGTVLNVEQAQRAIDAGARFIVSPGFNPAVVKYCIEKDIPITPGCSNPTDIEMALEYSLEVVKFFPAEASGGLKTLKAISAPYGMIQFIPTGGIDASNINEYLAFSKVLACGGSWMVKEDLIKDRNFNEITRLAREAVNKVLGFDVAHIGINTPDADSSFKTAKKFEDLFGFPIKEGNSSNFAGTGIEVNKSKGSGDCGHIAIKTNNIYRAIAYFHRNGIEVDMSTAKGPEKGDIVAVYLKEQIGGFAIHLLQNK